MPASPQPIAITVVPVTPFAQNCSIIVCTKTKRAAIVDPGGDLPQIKAALARTGAMPEKILITHGHIDHAGFAADLAEELKLPVEGPHEADKSLLDNLAVQGNFYGFSGARPLTPTRWLAEGETVTVGDLTFDVRHIPGHAPGHVVFISREAPIAIVGDTLFQGSIGRTDLPGGSHDQLIEGIQAKLLTLPEETIILPGHGNASTIGEEKRNNPFLA